MRKCLVPVEYEILCGRCVLELATLQQLHLLVKARLAGLGLDQSETWPASKK
jgi:hypothetical protein